MTTVADLFAAYERLTVAAHPSVTDTHDGAVCVTVVGHGWPSTSAAVGRGHDRATARAEALAMLSRPLAYLRAVDALTRHLRAARTLGADQVDTSPAHRAEVFAAYHARACHYEVARERVAQGGDDGSVVRRSPLAEELDQSADEGTRVRATSLPDAHVEVPAIDAHEAGLERALADMAFTHGWMLFEEGM